MTRRFFIRLANLEKFEEVSEQVFTDRRLALNDADQPRYSDDYVVTNEQQVEKMQLGSVPKKIIPMISRFLGLPEVAGSMIGGFLSEPSHIKFQKGRARWLLEVPTGVKYKQS